MCKDIKCNDDDALLMSSYVEMVVEVLTIKNFFLEGGILVA